MKYSVSSAQAMLGMALGIARNSWSQSVKNRGSRPETDAAEKRYSEGCMWPEQPLFQADAHNLLLHWEKSHDSPRQTTFVPSQAYRQARSSPG